MVLFWKYMRCVNLIYITSPLVALWMTLWSYISRNRVNQILLFLVVLMFGMFWYSSKVNYAGPESSEPEVIPVVICAAAGRLGGAVAAVNSIYSNTKARVIFYLVGLKNTIPHIRTWIEDSDLKKMKFKIVEFNPMVLKGKICPDAAYPKLLMPLNFVQLYIPLLIGKHKNVIYLDDDIIVQGDIQELYETKISPGHVAAFSDDCDLPWTNEMIRSVGMQSTYMGFLDYRRDTIRNLGISPSTCSFNPGVMVANMTQWKRLHIMKQLEKWMLKNVEENIYSSTLGGGVATPPMLLVFYGKHSVINPLWHVRHLGWSPHEKYSSDLLAEAKLLNWNGKYKPWDYPSIYTELWEKWYIPDPTGEVQIALPQN